MAGFSGARRARGLVLAVVAAAALAAPWPNTRAQVVSGPQRAVNWDKALTAIRQFRPVLDVSGLVEVDASIPTPLDSENLPALCQARTEAVALAREAGQRELGALGNFRDPITDTRRADLQRYLASIAIFGGKVDAAVEHLEAARMALAPYLEEYPDLRPRSITLSEAAGIVQMRRGEAENCLVNPGSDRCLFPIRPGGVHTALAGALSAMDHFRAVLVSEPENLEVRWLLNVAAMLAGQYPRGVPAAQLIPDRAFQSDAPMARFADVARAAGLGRLSLAGGTVAEDFDADGLIDVALSSVDFCAPLRIYRNRGDGTFEDRSEAAGVMDQLGGLNLAVTDYNNDGRPDLFVLRGGWEIPMRNSLLRNNGDGTFTDVTSAAGLSSGAHSSHYAAWFDYDNDGWLDVFVRHELTASQLFRNRGDGTFEDVSARAGVGASAFTKGVVAGDYDNDGWPDLYLSNMWGDNVLYRNNGNGTFTDVAATAGVQKPFASFPTWFFDYDNDGRLDIFVSSYPMSVEEFAKHYIGQPPAAETLTLYHNLGNGRFENVSAQMGLARAAPTMGSNFGDLDNDGYLDMYLGTGSPSYGAILPNVMLKNDAGRRFLDVTEATGTGHLQKGHGVAFADLDNDGDEDVVLNVGGAVPGDIYDDALFRNPGQSGNHWVALRLIGQKANRLAIGARITLRLKDGSLRYREVTSGGSFGCSPLLQHIGLGRADAIASIAIQWPGSRTIQTLTGTPVDRLIEVSEGGAYRIVQRQAFTLGGR